MSKSFGENGLPEPGCLPLIYQRGYSKHPNDEGIANGNSLVPTWKEVREKSTDPLLSANAVFSKLRTADSMSPQKSASVAQQTTTSNPGAGTSKSLLKSGKNQVSGKPFTSRFRGVHRTIPTKRWEAQFRKDGKPTSLGCFDTEESAAKAYDKMMVWCELHQKNGGKPCVTNFDPEEYKGDVLWLQGITQDELLQELRREGREEAASRGDKVRKHRETQNSAGTRKSRRMT